MADRSIEALSLSEREDIWDEGYRAFGGGEPEHCNPYPGSSIEHEIWSDGWEDGQEDEQQAEKKRVRK